MSVIRWCLLRDRMNSGFARVFGDALLTILYRKRTLRGEALAGGATEGAEEPNGPKYLPRACWVCSSFGIGRPVDSPLPKDASSVRFKGLRAASDVHYCCCAEASNEELPFLKIAFSNCWSFRLDGKHQIEHSPHHALPPLPRQGNRGGLTLRLSAVLPEFPLMGGNQC